MHATGQRYHPVISAQAIATLGEMFPGRFWAALGSGENMNEHVTGDPWPDKPTRDAAFAKMMANEEIMAIPAPFDGKRMIYGGFKTLLDL